jgi:HNH endonuclease
MLLSGTRDERAVAKRCYSIFAHHKRRAKSDRAELSYALGDLVRLVREALGCAYCGCLLSPATFSIDHKLPTSRAVCYTLENLAVCCLPCNEAKGLLNHVEFQELLAVSRHWHPKARQDLLARLRRGAVRRAGKG